MADISLIPLWLDIKKEYIDENFDAVVSYLQQYSSIKDTDDSFYRTTVHLLKERMNTLIASIAAAPLQEDMCKDEDLNLFCRMCGLYMLVFPEDTELRRNAFSLMLQTLLLINHQNETELAEMAAGILIGRAPLKQPFGWEDIKNFNGPALAVKIIGSEPLGTGLEKECWYEEYGSISIKDGTLEVSAMHADETALAQLATSIEIFDGKLKILSTRGSKVKASEANNLDAMRSFTNDFLLTMKENGRKKKAPKKVYEEGDKATVEIIRKVSAANKYNLRVKTIDKGYETIEGTIPLSSTMNYSQQDFYEYLTEGNIIKATLVNAGKKTFSFDNEFKDFIIKERASENCQMTAYIEKVIPDSKGQRKAYMWTEYGYVAQGYAGDTYDIGDYVNIEISKYGEGKYYGVVMTDIKDYSEDSFNIRQVKQQCIQSFGSTPVKVGEVHEISIETLRILSRILIGYQKQLPSPSDRYRVLCFLKVLAGITDNPEDTRYLSFLSDYMEALVLFAKSEYYKLQPLNFEGDSEPETVQRRKRIVQVISAYGNDERNDELSDFIHNDPDELIRKIATLVQSCNRIDHFISKSTQNLIKREVIKCLELDIETVTDLEEENGTYVGYENDRMEFKTSFFFPPANAKERNQKLTILRGICAFLNSSTGGTLYLGVNDLGYVKGIQGDIEHLETVSNGWYHGIEGYMRHITDEAKKHWDINIMTHIKIDGAFKNKAVEIKVEPYELGIVSIKDEAFIRINSETRRMSDNERRRILIDRINSKKESAETLSTLMEAVETKCQVVLLGYRSSSGGDIRDRLVEPFAFASGGKTVWCYDVESKTNKLFKIDRILNVELTKDSWQYKTHHKEGKTDIFRLTSDTTKTVELELSMRARNILVEEYPEAKKYIKPTEDNDRWIFRTEVCRMEGIGRFYMGLAEEITIIDAPGLKEYAEQYVKEHILN